MNKLEIACVIVGLIGMLMPARIKISTANFADILVALGFWTRYVICGLMILLPLYFNLWKK